MSVSSDVRNDIEAARKLWLPWWVVLALIAFSLPVIWLSDHFGRLAMALPILNCIGVFGLIVYLKWNLRRRLWFWVTIALLATIHTFLILYIPWTSKWVPALAIAVISSVDVYLILWILAAVGRLVEGRPLRDEASRSR
jgi:hypothetical protein